MHLFNNADHTNQLLLFKTEGGKKVVGSKQKGGRERKREADEGCQRQSIRENQKWRGLKTDR